MNNVVLNANQLFQLAALGPCLFITLYIIISSTRFSLSVVPVCFFLSLSGTFVFPILSLFPEFSESSGLNTVVIINDNMLPALSFLLIMQFVFSKIPPLLYWFIFAIPFVGGGGFIYLALTQEIVCLLDNVCYSSEYLETMYSIFGSALMFMLLIVVLSRNNVAISKKDRSRQHKYWLLITLVAFNLLLIGNDLALVAGNIPIEEAEFVSTMIGVGFVYVVLSSVFRVFSGSLGIKNWKIRGKSATAHDRWLAEKIIWILREEKPYRNMGFNRAALAEILDIKEYNLSRIINERFGKSFSELMNGYRIRDAKEALRQGEEPITTISFDSGFSSLTSFNRVFKEATGFSPSAYRKAKTISL